MMQTLESVVAVCDTQAHAEHTVKELQAGGVEIDCLLIAAKGIATDQLAAGNHDVAEHMKTWGEIGAFCGGFWGLFSDRPCSRFQVWGKYLWLVRSVPGSYPALRARW